MNIEKLVKEVIKEQLGWGNIEQLTLNTSPKDVGLYSFDEIEIIMVIEEEFDTEIPDGVAESFNTLGDIITFLEKEDHHNKFGKDRVELLTENILASFPVPEDNVKKNIYEESLSQVQAHFLSISDEEFVGECKEAGVNFKKYNPVKNISREKYYRCAKRNPNLCDQFNSDRGVLFMSESACGKYYYWEGYNSKNEIIYLRGEKSWVEDNYVKAVAAKSKKPREVSSDVKKVIDKIKDNFKEGAVLEENLTTWTDKHYDFNYTLTEDDIEKGVLKIDPYFVNRMWRINSWDDTGAAFHSLKNYARICNGKNPLERDLKSLYKQVKRLCELHGVEL